MAGEAAMSLRSSPDCGSRSTAPGVEHAEPMPSGIPHADELPDLEDHLVGLHPMSKRMFTDRPLDVRHVPGPIYLHVEGEHVPHQAVWLRTRRSLPDDPDLHRAALAYLSDMTIQESVLRALALMGRLSGSSVRLTTAAAVNSRSCTSRRRCAMAMACSSEKRWQTCLGLA